MKARTLRSILAVVMFTGALISCSDDGDNTSQRSQHSSPTPPSLSTAQRQSLQETFATTPFKVLHIAELSYDNAPALAVTFSAPLDPKADWQDYLTLVDDDNKAVSGAWILGEELNRVYFPFIEPETRYTVGVNSGLPALTGRLLEADQEQNITTKAKQQSLRFVSQGTQLSTSLSEGLSVEAVNVAAVDIDFLKVRDSKIADFLQYNLSGNYYDLTSIRHYTDLAYSARFDLNHGKNQRLRSVLPIAEIEELEQPGLYLAVMKGAGHYPYEHQITWFSIGDIGLQVRQLDNQLLAFTHYAQSAKPAADTTITLFDDLAEPIAEITTDDQGFADFKNLAKQPTFATAQQGQHYAVLKLRSAAMDLSEFSLPSRQQHPLELFLYSERDLYRPGEKVTINGLLRDHDGKLNQASPIGVQINTPDGRVYRSFTWQGDDNAWYSQALQLPDQAMRGQWRFVATLGNGDEFTYRFSVEDFLPERMKLELTRQEERNLATGTPISIAVQGDYLYGVPAAGNRLEARVQSQQARTLFEEQFEDFIFGAESYNDYDMDFELPAAELDDQGQLTLDLPQHWADANQPIRVNTQVSLFESGGRPVTRSIEHLLWPQETLVGLRPTWEGDRASPDSDALLEIIHVNNQQELVAAEHLDVLVVREDQQQYWRWQDNWQQASSQQEIPVYNQVLALAANERGQINIPVEYGHYRVEVRDQQQNLLTSYRFFAGWQWDKPQPGATGRPDQIPLEWTADAFQPGDTAQLNFVAPYSGRALITVEADGLRWHTQQTVSAGDNSVDIPVANDWSRHDLYATVTLLRAGDAKHKQLPKRAFGLIHLPLDREDRQLALQIDAPDKVKPKTTLTVDVAIDNLSGQDAYLTLAAVDTGVLSISRFETPSPFQWFFAPRGYAHDIHDTWSNFIEQLSDRKARQRFGGDGDELARGGEAPQTDVQIVSLFSGKVAIGDDGRASIPLELPYFNGELRLMAVAWSADRMGNAESLVTVAAPLIAEVSTPRFMARGDSATATFDLQNLTETEQQLEITITADSALGNQQQTSQMVLAPQQRQTLQLPLAAQRGHGAGTVALQVNSDSGDIELTRDWQVGLRPPYPAQTTQIDKVLSPGDSFNVPDRFQQGYESGSRQLFVNVSPNPPLNLTEQLDQLFQYPYGCLEQTTSRAWPLLASRESDLERFDPTEDKQLSSQREAIIVESIGRVSAMQRGDGSFGMWSNQDNEYHWLTVYATEFLLAANERGYPVAETVLEGALQRLNDYLKTQGPLWTENYYYTSWPDHYHFSYRAYAALVLARKQQASLGDLRTLYDNHGEAARTSLPLAQMALALELAGDSRRAQEAWGKALAMDSRPEGYSGDYGSAIRDLASTLHLAMESQLVEEPQQGLITLRDKLIGQRWLSTQERWSLYQLGLQLASIQLDDWTLALTTDNSQQDIDLSQDYQKSWRGEAIPDQLAFSNPNEQVLYLNLQHNGYPLRAPKPMSEGLVVQRHFYNEKGQPLDVSQLTTGDLVLVMLQLSGQDTDEIIPDALLVDLLPAGLELENQNLDTAVKMDDIVVEGMPVQEWLYNAEIQHQEYRDDRYVAALKLDPYRFTTVFYLARAVTPGTYRLPPSQVEAMYRPWLRAVAESPSSITISPK